MKKGFIGLLLVLMLIMSLGGSAFAAGASPAKTGVEPDYTRYTPYEGTHLIDSYGLLTAEEQAAIEAYAKEASNRHNCGIYVMLVEDYTALYGNSKIFETNYTYYHEHNMGFGEGRDGVFLLLSMKERDFSFFVYGERAEYALNPWGQIKLEEAFIDDLGDNHWFDGLQDFVDTCDDFLTRAEAGEPVREQPYGKIALSTGISAFIAFVISRFLWNKNPGAVMMGSASGYSIGKLTITRSEDNFVKTTVKKRRVYYSNDSSSGATHTQRSTAHRGGGGSGRSGKF